MINKKNITIGIISDSHGKINDKIGEVFSGIDLIIHAGDIEEPFILDYLKTIAPVVMARGNCDIDDWASNIPDTQIVQLGQHKACVVHNPHTLSIDLNKENINILIHGHTHIVKNEFENGILTINPGSAAGIRSGIATVALLKINDSDLDVSFIEI